MHPVHHTQTSLWCLFFFFFFFFILSLSPALERGKFLMFEKQLSHGGAYERKQHRPPESNPLCGHLISSTDIKALTLTSNCISSCEASSLLSLPSPPYSFSSHLVCLRLLPKGTTFFFFFFLPPPQTATTLYIYSSFRLLLSFWFFSPPLPVGHHTAREKWTPGGTQGAGDSVRLPGWWGCVGSPAVCVWRYTHAPRGWKAEMKSLRNWNGLGFSTSKASHCLLFGVGSCRARLGGSLPQGPCTGPGMGRTSWCPAALAKRFPHSEMEGMFPLKNLLKKSKCSFCSQKEYFSTLQF